MKKTLLLFCLGLTVQSMTATEANPFQDKNASQIAAVSDGTMWIDLAASSFEGGDGTAESPYLIKTAEQLAKLAKDVKDDNKAYNGTYFKMVDDIDLDGHDWYPIGYKYTEGEESVGTSFCGIFDGGGHKITNLNITGTPEYKAMGMFGNTEEGFELRNLTIESGNITGDVIVGAFVGSNNGIIENCVNKANVSCLFYYVAGIVGSNYRQGTVKHCTNYGYILAGSNSANGMTAGGVAGSNYNIIEECANYGKVEAVTTGAGGVVAMLEGGTIRNCFNAGEVSGVEHVGGIVGEALGRGGNCEIYNCYNVGTLEGTAAVGSGVGMAIFQNFNKLTVKNIYTSSDIFSGSACGSATDFFGNFDITETPAMTSEEMKAEAFVTTLNEGSETEETIWLADTKSINDGFPILSYMDTEATGITSQKLNDNVSVYPTDGRIVVEGADGKQMQVYTIDGRMVYSGKAANVSSKSGLYVVRVGNKSYKVVVK